MKRLTVAVDIDMTLRNLVQQFDIFLEIDHPDKVDAFRAIKDDTYYCLDPVFKSIGDKFKWMYEERVFELFGLAKRIHPKVIDDLNIFSNSAKQAGYDVVIASVQRNQSVTSTLHWLAKWGCRIQRYEFFDSMEKKVERDFDVYVDDSPHVVKRLIDQPKRVHPTETQLTSIPRVIKVPYKFTKDFDCPSLDIANGKFDDLYDILGVEKIIKK